MGTLLQTELNYSQQGTGIVSAENGFGSFNTDYLTIPVLAKFYGTPQLSFFAGPQLGIRLNGKVKSTNELEDNLDEILKTTDLYLVFGGEYRFANGLFVNGRYNMGMLDIAKDADGLSPEIKNRYWSFRLGYSFKLGK